MYMLILLLEGVRALIIGFSFVTIFIFSIIYFSRKSKLLRVLHKLPFKTLKKTKDRSLTKLEGKASYIKQPLIAPFSKKECIFYFLEVRLSYKTAKGSKSVSLLKTEEIQDFFISIDDKFVIVQPQKKPKNYHSYLKMDTRLNSNKLQGSKEHEQTLKQLGINLYDEDGEIRNLHCTEGCIEINEPIVVAGIARWKNINIENYNYSRILTLEHSAKQDILITDSPDAFKNKKDRCNFSMY